MLTVHSQVSWHACLRVRIGSGGGASVKSSLPIPIIQEHLIKLGGHLKWHGALSLDAILEEGNPKYIDINPRIVEPMNALYSGVDLVEDLIEVSLGHSLSLSKPKVGSLGVESHQTVLALVGACLNGRRAVFVEFFVILLSLEDFAHSKEELTPITGDPITLLVLLGLFILLLFHGAEGAKKMSRAAVSKYALSPEGWDAILEKRAHGDKKDNT